RIAAVRARLENPQIVGRPLAREHGELRGPVAVDVAVDEDVDDRARGRGREVGVLASPARRAGAGLEGHDRAPGLVADVRLAATIAVEIADRPRRRLLAGLLDLEQAIERQRLIEL